MLNGISFLGALLSRFALRVVSAAVASVCAGYMLTQLHLVGSGEADKATQPVVYTPAGDDAPTAAEIRAQTRELLKNRRENVEAPAEVKRTAKAAETKAAETKPAEPKVAAPATVASVPASRAAVTAAPPAALGTLVLPRTRPQGEAMDSVGTDMGRTASISPSANQGASQVSAMPPPVVIGSGAPPSIAATPRPVALPAVPVDMDRDNDQPRSFAFQLFSAISNITGKGANAVGDSVNWVGGLPGRAVSAGERVFTPQPAPAPSSAPPPQNGAQSGNAPRQFSNGL